MLNLTLGFPEKEERGEVQTVGVRFQRVEAKSLLSLVPPSDAGRQTSKISWFLSSNLLRSPLLSDPVQLL